MLILAFTEYASSRNIDFSSASITLPPGENELLSRYAQILQQEIQKRTGLLLPIDHDAAYAVSPQIILRQKEIPSNFPSEWTAALEKLPSVGPEGFKLVVLENPRPVAIILGYDTRGVLYGIGRLLRKMTWHPNSVDIPADLQLATTPKYAIRGHQLGYRPKTNAYDAWSVGVTMDLRRRRARLAGGGTMVDSFVAIIWLYYFSVKPRTIKNRLPSCYTEYLFVYMTG